MATIIKAKGINREKFFGQVRSKLFGGKLTISQVKGMIAILNEWEKRGLTDLRWLAYMLGTVYHETGRTMQAIEEVGKGKSCDYGKMLKRGGGPGRRIPYKSPIQIYYGRGLIQITWYENYQLMGKILKIDLLNNPDLALRLDISVAILFEGMLRALSAFGDFTGKCLEMYFDGKKEDWVNARTVVNGLDCAYLIAEYSKMFNEILLAA